MTEFDSERYSDEELIAEFDRLFSVGFSSADVLQELAPGGWQDSPLKSVFHPSPSQVFEESLALHRNINSLCKPEWLNYSPSESLAKEAEELDRDQELAELRESLDEGYREAIEESQHYQPPETVRAYQAVYGRFPQGWPPEV